MFVSLQAAFDIRLTQKLITVYAGASFYQITNHPRFEASQSSSEIVRRISWHSNMLRQTKQEKFETPYVIPFV